MADANTILFDVCQLTPSEMSYDVVGSAIDGGRSLSGASQAIDISGGGLVRAQLAGITMLTRAQHLYWNKVAGLLNGSVRDIYIPFMTDPLLDPAIADHSATAAAAALHATLISITGAVGDLTAGMWLSIQHPVPIGHRAYRIIDTGVLAGSTMPCTIRPALRQAIGAATPVRFERPRCTMQLPPGVTMAWSWLAPGGFAVDQAIELIEAF